MDEIKYNAFKYALLADEEFSEHFKTEFFDFIDENGDTLFHIALAGRCYVDEGWALPSSYGSYEQFLR